MDKVISVRVSEAIADRFDSAAKRQGKSKKSIIEEAIQKYVDSVDENGKIDVFEETCGAWKRDEPIEETVRKARSLFAESMNRYQS